MALIHIDGFDHYGDDETKLTEGVYDQADSAFSLSSVNPRTGNRNIRRDTSQVDATLLFNLQELKETVGTGLAFYLSSLPAAVDSYELLSFYDSSQAKHFSVIVQDSGFLYLIRGGLGGFNITQTDRQVIFAGRYHHLEIAARPERERGQATTVFSEQFISGLDPYTIEDEEFFSIDSTVKGNAITITNANDAGSPDGLATRSIPNREYQRVTFFGRVNSDISAAPLDTDIAIFRLRSDSSIAISTILSRDDEIPGSNERLFINDTAIGSAKLNVGEWYFFDFNIDWTAGTFDYEITDSSETVFASGNLSLLATGGISFLQFTTDVEAAETLGDSGSYADINLYITEDVGNETGICEVRVDGVTVISGADFNLTSSDDLGFQYIGLSCGGSISAHGVTTDIDDWYIWDDQGAWNNSFIGDRRCYLLKPNQDTNIADFEPSSGSFGYKMIDDDSPDDDSTYIIAEAYLQSGSPLTGTSEFEIEDLTDGTSLISGINVVTRASKTDSTSAEFFTSINAGANSVSQSAHTLTTSYRYFSDIYEYDPSTISSLTKDGFDDLSVSITADDLQEEITVISPDIVSPSVIPGSPTDNDPAIPSDYVARYIFDGDFTDETGNYNGTNSGSTFLSSGQGPGGSNVGINTGGSTKHVNLPSSLASAVGSGASTIVFWARATATTDILIPISSSNNTVTNRFYAAELGNGSNLFPRYVQQDGGTADIVRGTTAASTATWVPVVIRSSGSTSSFRLNGVNLSKSVDVGTDTGDTIGDVTGITNVTIGRIVRSTPVTAQAFDLGPMTLYNRELSDSECAQLEGEY